ncbi:DUF445 domain-containing protein [Romboutsia sp.]|uniref:DUF445 domain-containing protein n=1 Tax=Romboutsia sp. TaxID=1965302 RepID=UPI003F4041F5
MNNMLKILILASIGGLIGYITNVVAIKLIFRPIEPIKIPFTNKEIIGLIPKRRGEIANNIGEVIAKEFLTIDEILENAITEADKDELVEYINVKIKTIVNEKMAFVPSAIKSIVLGYISEALEEEIKKCINELEEDIIIKVNQRIDIQQMVEDKINELDLYYLEEIIIKIVKNELKHIEILGLVLGFLIGIVQGVITILI